MLPISYLKSLKRSGRGNHNQLWVILLGLCFLLSSGVGAMLLYQEHRFGRRELLRSETTTVIILAKDTCGKHFCATIQDSSSQASYSNVPIAKSQDSYLLVGRSYKVRKEIWRDKQREYIVFSFS